MLIVHVHVKVKAEFIEAFKTATVANARASRKESGIARFVVPPATSLSPGDTVLVGERWL